MNLKNINVMLEIWRTVVIKGETYDNYQVSNFGNVMSLNYNRSRKCKLLKPRKDRGGYLQVVFCKNGKMKNFLVHQLVAKAFLQNPENLPFINHKDEDKTNNSVDNLEYCTREYNNNYGTRNERASKAKTNGKLSKPVLQFTKNGDFICEYPSIAECGRNGFNEGNIAACCRGERKSADGYIWRYK